MLQNRFRLISGDHGGKRGHVGLFHRLQAAEVLKQSSRGPLTYAGDFAQLSGAVAHLAAFAMEGHGKAVGLIADELHQMQDRIVVIEDDRFVLLSADVNDLFALGDGCKRLVDDLERTQRFSSGVQLA
jgi:hypothetical protein